MTSKKSKRSRSSNSSKYGKKKTYKKQSKAVILYCPKICPDVMRVQLPYVHLETIQGGGTVNLDGRVYRLNSVFDPIFAVGGGQPLGFDQWAAFYNEYRVRGSSIKITASSDAAETAEMMIVPLTTSALLLSREQYAEQQYAKKLVIGNDTQHGIGTLSHYISVAQLMGAPDDIVEYDDNLRAAVSANPNKGLYWHVLGMSYGGGSTTNFVVSVRVEITYYVDFMDRATLIRS